MRLITLGDVFFTTPLKMACEKKRGEGLKAFDLIGGLCKVILGVP